MQLFSWWHEQKQKKQNKKRKEKSVFQAVSYFYQSVFNTVTYLAAIKGIYAD